MWVVRLAKPFAAATCGSPSECDTARFDITSVMSPRGLRSNRRRARGALEPKHVRSIRVRLELAGSKRVVAIFNLTIDSKLRAATSSSCAWTKSSRALQYETERLSSRRRQGVPVQLEINQQSRKSVEAYLQILRFNGTRSLFPIRLHASLHGSTRQYARLAQVGGKHRLRHEIVRHAHDASDQGSATLPKDRQPTRGSTPPRSHEVGKYGSVFGDRSRGRTEYGRTDRALDHGHRPHAGGHIAPEAAVERAPFNWAA